MAQPDPALRSCALTAQEFVLLPQCASVAGLLSGLACFMIFRSGFHLEKTCGNS
jgi:hypothetical protein